MPDIDDVNIMEGPKLEALSIDLLNSLGACASARKTSVRGVDTPDFKDCQRVSVAIDASRQSGGREGPVYSSVWRLMSRDSATSVFPEQELAELDVAPEEEA